ncbi:Uncharacterised protein [Bordetella pertussis]|nr:Uncharacterised protein [Bordetella pertussis]CPM59892.1 Uncharacterised protein [Bordetella pertussis]
MSSAKKNTTRLWAVSAIRYWRRGEPLSARISMRIWWLRTNAMDAPTMVSTISRKTEISSVQAKDWSVR